MKVFKDFTIVEISDVEKLFDELTPWDKVAFLEKQLNKPEYYNNFINRINSVLQYCYNMFMNANASKHTEEQINDLMINLMNTLVRYKNSYRPVTYAYRVMNSLLDIVKNTFVELN